MKRNGTRGRYRCPLPTVAIAGLAFLSLASCGSRTSPYVGEPRAAEPPRRVLVFVPGITGSKLRDAESGKVVWGRGGNLVGPRDGGYRLALPVAGNGGRELRPDGILRRIRLLFFKRSIYQPLIEFFTANGFQIGRLEAPQAGDDLYFYAYDWRQDNIASAQRLHAALEGVRRAHGETRLAIDLVCQSNGGYICRWLARYGGSSLEQALAGRAAPSTSVAVHNVVLVGTANAGSLRTLREMTRGRRYIPFFGKRFEPETFFTITAFFQDLPTYRRDLFVDLDGQAMDVAIFDPASWEAYGWSIFGPQAAKSLAKRRSGAAIFGDLMARRAHLEAMLGRAEALQSALVKDTPIHSSSRFHLIQNVSWPTPDRGVLVPARKGGWDLLFTGDKALRKRPQLLAAVSADGDGHAPLASQLHLAPSERQAMVGDIFPVVAAHFETILEPATHRRLIEILRSP